MDRASFLEFPEHGQKVLMTHFRYAGISRAYTKGLATELKAASQSPKESDGISQLKRHFLASFRPVLRYVGVTINTC